MKEFYTISKNETTEIIKSDPSGDTRLQHDRRRRQDRGRCFRRQGFPDSALCDEAAAGILPEKVRIICDYLQRRI